MQDPKGVVVGPSRDLEREGSSLLLTAMPDRPRTPFDDLDATSVLDAQEVADRLGVQARSVRRAISRGDLPASRACGLRILVADAAEWWRSRRVVAAVEAGERPAPVPRAGAKRSLPAAPRSGRPRLPLPPHGGA